METYQTPLARLEMTLDGFSEGKSRIVKEWGIGETLPLTLVAWHGGTLARVFEIHPDIADRQKRFETIVEAAFAMRAEGATSFSLVSEGYRSDSVAPETKVERFAAGDPTVSEVLVVMQVEPGLAYVASAAFVYNVPRRVIFGVPNVEQTFGGAFQDALTVVLQSDGVSNEGLLRALKVWDF